MNILTEALLFASRKHSTQKRKDPAESPYVNHLIDVLHTLVHDGGFRDEELLAAGVLHDTIEDTETTDEELRNHFGDRVADLVLEVTDDKGLEKMERKRLQIENAPKKSTGAKVIKLADKISNLRSILLAPLVAWSNERKRDYFIWAKQVIDGLRGDHPSSEGTFDQVYEKGRIAFK